MSAETRAAIDAAFAEFDGFDTPGASLAVVKDGAIAYLRGYGLADLESGTPVTPQTPFHVASVSKQFTDYAVVLLDQAGELSLDDDVRRHIPELPDFGSELTLRHLGHHTSGIRDQWELLAIQGTRLDDVITTQHILQLATRQRELNFEPGAEYMYSNMGFTLLAEAASRASGKSFPELCADLIFKPLRMARTHFHDDHRHLVPGRAYSYDRAADGGWQKTVLSYANAGATSLFTTAEDLGRWILHLASTEGEPATRTLLQKGRLNDGSEIDYALGLVHGELRGVRTLSHGGADAGFRSILLIFPDHDLGVVVLANSPAVDPSRRASEVAEILLGDEMAALPDEAAASEGPTEEIELSPEVLEKLAGTYRLAELGLVLEVTVREGALFTTVPGTGELQLRAVGEREFLLPELSGRVRFDLADEGRAMGLRVRVPGQQLEGLRFEPLAGVDLGVYEGWYFSPEVETLYRIEAKDSVLVAHHVRNGSIDLVPLEEDGFQGSEWFFGSVAFERDAKGEVAAFRLSGGRVRNLLFRRLDSFDGP